MGSNPVADMIITYVRDMIITYSGCQCLNTPNQDQQSQMLPFLGEYRNAKNQRYEAVLPEILITKESCNLIGQEFFGISLVKENFRNMGGVCS